MVTVLCMFVVVCLLDDMPLFTYWVRNETNVGHLQSNYQRVERAVLTIFGINLNR